MGQLPGVRVVPRCTSDCVCASVRVRVQAGQDQSHIHIGAGGAGPLLAAWCGISECSKRVQAGQDRVVAELLEGRRGGFFVDLSSSDPVASMGQHSMQEHKSRSGPAGKERIA